MGSRAAHAHYKSPASVSPLIPHSRFREHVVSNIVYRKRAKTAAEKEQRRIERVLRNRAAAHASRERRRKELEGLEDEKAILEQDNNNLKSRLAAFEEENASLSERMKEMEKQLKSFEDTIKIFTGMGGSLAGLNPSSFASFTNNSPLSLTSVIPSPVTPAPERPVGSNEALGMTHQSAALMCDLQCLPTASNPQQPSVELVAIWMMQCILLEMIASTLYSVQMPFLQLFLNLKRGTPISNSDLVRFFPLIRWLVSTKPTRQLRQRLLTCSPALALLSKEATGRALWWQVARSWSGQFGSGTTIGDAEGGGLDPASECRRIVRELQARGNSRLDKANGNGSLSDLDFIVGTLNGKFSGGR